MKLKKLSLKNIRSYRSQEIIFPEGSILLTGDIGAGKSSLLLAIEYALFGLQPGQRGASLLRNSAHAGEVILEMDIGGRSIVIERRLKRSHKTVTNESAVLVVDNQRMEASLTEVKIKILEWMGYPSEFIKKNNLLYRYTVYTPQEQMKQIILEDAETRLNILRHILGVDKYKRIRENLTLLLNQLKEESKLLQGEIKSLDEEKSRLEIKKIAVKTLEQEINLKATEVEQKMEARKKCEGEAIGLESKIKEKDYLEKEVEKTKIMIANKYEHLATIDAEMKEIDKLLLERDNIPQEEEYHHLIKEIAKKALFVEELNAYYASLFAEVNSLEKQQEEASLKRERIFKIEICPTCLQDVPAAHKHNILNETENVLGKTKQKIVLLEEGLVVITQKIEKEKEEKKVLEEKKTTVEILRTRLEYLEKSEKKREHLQKNLENIGKDIALLNKHGLNLKEKILVLGKFEHLTHLKKEELKMALQEERKAEIALAETKKEVELMKRDIIVREESIAAKEKTKQNLSSLLELHDWLSINFLELMEFIESNVLLKLRQEFSRVFDKWFHMLVPQGGLTVRLDESFSPVILDKEVEMEYAFLSGGERTALALAYRLALNQTINSLLSKIRTKDIVILDEPTDGFSEAQLDRMREILQELKVLQLIIVSHERKMESFVENIIRVKKSGEVSYIETEALLNLPLDLLEEPQTIPKEMETPLESNLDSFRKT